MAKTVQHKELQSFFGDEDHLLVSQKSSFAQLIYEMLSEKVPTSEELKLFELILNLSIDHGAETPSATATIQAALDGKTLSESVAAGILQINSSHGGAIEPAMEILYDLQKKVFTHAQLVDEFFSNDKRIPGVGHRIYKQSLPSEDGKEADPRAQLIFEKMQELEFNNGFVEIAKNLRDEAFKQSGKALTINIDGAIAVALCTLSWDPKLSNAVFIIARTPGLCAQFLNAKA